MAQSGGGGENTLFSVTPYNFQKGGEAEAPSPPGPPPSWSLCDSTAVEGKAFHTRKVLTKNEYLYAFTEDGNCLYLCTWCKR